MSLEFTFVDSSLEMLLEGAGRVPVVTESDVPINRVARAAANLPQTATGTLFTTAGGTVIIHSILGLVEGVGVQAQANLVQLLSNGKVWCAQLDINGDVIGTTYSLTGLFADAMRASTEGTDEGQQWFYTSDDIELSASASSTGQVGWVVLWSPHTDGATVVAA